MNIKQIIGFNALAKVLNFSKAADSVYLTQPAFSRMIQSLEEELGGQLFVRSKTSPQLTVLGAQVLPEFQEMERHYENMLMLIDHAMRNLNLEGKKAKGKASGKWAHSPPRITYHIFGR